MAKRYEIALGGVIATAFWATVALFYKPQIETVSIAKDFAGPIATLVAASAAGWIAYTLGQGQIAVAKSQADIAKRSWQTSNEKVVLDLFERRLKIVDGIREVVSEVLRTGQPNDKDYFDFCLAVDRVSYFFGSEVVEYLETVRHLIIELQLDAIIIKDHHSPDRTKRIRGHADRMKTLVEFYETSKNLFGPYIKAHQKAD